MKTILFAASTLFITGVASAQTDSTLTVTHPTTVAETTVPAHLKGLTTETLRPEHSFPALGSYTATGSSSAAVSITLDETNKGMVWVEGLPQGKFKALMRARPATYKIPAQTTADGKQVPEGTLFLNPESKELTITLGRPFNDADPTASLAIPTKTKSKVWQYSGVKADAATSVAPSSQQ